MPILEQDFFVIKFADGTYRTIEYPSLLPQNDIARIIKYCDLEDAKDAAVDFNSHGRKCEIVPIIVTIKERKHKDLLVYHFSPKNDPEGTGWLIRSEHYMRSYWNIQVPFSDKELGYGALTD